MTKTKEAASLSIANYDPCTVCCFSNLFALCTVRGAFFSKQCAVFSFSKQCALCTFSKQVVVCSVQCVVLSGFLPDR